MPLFLLKADLPRTPSQISKGIGVILKASFEVPTTPSAGGLCVSFTQAAHCLKMGQSLCLIYAGNTVSCLQAEF